MITQQWCLWSFKFRCIKTLLCSSVFLSISRAFCTFLEVSQESVDTKLLPLDLPKTDLKRTRFSCWIVLLNTLIESIVTPTFQDIRADEQSKLNQCLLTWMQDNGASSVPC